MQIKYLGGKRFNLRTKESKIILDGNVDIEGFLIDGPGEFERKNIFVEGIGPDREKVVYVIRVDEIVLGYLGKIKKIPKDEEIKRVGDIDILFVPLGEEDTLDIKTAGDLISKIDPKVVIPMLYDDISKFKEAEGVTNGEIDIYKVKKVDLPSEERQIVIIRKT